MRPHKLEDTLIEFNKYLESESVDNSPAALEAKMRVVYNGQWSLIDSHFHLTTVYSDENHTEAGASTSTEGQDPEAAAVIEQMKTILETLQIKREHWAPFFNDLNIHEFFTEVHCHLDSTRNSAKLQVSHILKLIEEKTAAKNDYKSIYLLLVFLVLAFGIALVASGNLPAAIAFIQTSTEFLQNLLHSSPVIMPMISTFVTTTSTLYMMYKNYTDKKRSLHNRKLENSFLFASKACVVLGHSLLIATSSVSNPVSAFLFVLGSAMNVFKEIKIARDLKAQFNLEKTQYYGRIDLAAAQQMTRLLISHEKHVKEALINLSSSLLTLGAVAIMCCVPGGAAVTGVALLIMGITALIQNLCLKYNEYAINVKMQKSLRAMSIAYETDLEDLEEQSPLERDLEEKTAAEEKEVPTSPRRGGPRTPPLFTFDEEQSAFRIQRNKGLSMFKEERNFVGQEVELTELQFDRR